MLCLVTDRRRLAGAGTPFDRARRCLAQQMQFAVDAGVDIVQVRERDLEAAALVSLVRDLVAIARRGRTRVVVNDRLDVALASGADGVHLRSDSFPTAEARRIAPPGFLIGRSVHGVDAARAAGDADYLIAGTVFPSESKGRSSDVIGVDGLRAIAASASCPVLGIGGIVPARFPEIAAAGAAGGAGIGLFIAGGTDRAACRAIAVRDIVNAARQTFDTVKTRP